jgi:uncharacterized membrane protein YfcA
MSMAQAALLVAAAFGAGALNSIAGGGSFLSFPALVFSGVPAVAANATSTVAIWPGSVASAWGYRTELASERERLLSLSLISLVGGVAGALLLLLTPSRVFEAMVPFLLLLATLIFTFGDAVRARVKAGSRASVLVLQVAIAIYGGYFGGGMGLMMLAAFTLMGMTDIHRMNALKSALGTLINGAAVVTFAIAGVVQWLPAGLMIAGAIAGGFGGAVLARRVDPKRVKPVVIVLGWVLTAAFFYRTFISPGA